MYLRLSIITAAWLRVTSAFGSLNATRFLACLSVWFCNVGIPSLWCSSPISSSLSCLAHLSVFHSGACVCWGRSQPHWRWRSSFETAAALIKEEDMTRRVCKWDAKGKVFSCCLCFCLCLTHLRDKGVLLVFLFSSRLCGIIDRQRDIPVHGLNWAANWHTINFVISLNFSRM